MSSKNNGTGLTFDDVLIIPDYSKILPKEVNLKTKVSRNININIPIISAAMDTVTESPMAIAMARVGGIGIIHKNMSIEQQSKQVKKVKRSESGMITDPITLNQDAKVGEALSIMEKNKIGGIPIVDKSNRLVGIVTNRDLFFEDDPTTEISKIMTKKNLITVNKTVTIDEAKEILKKYKIEKLPIVDNKMKIKGLITLKDIKKVKDFPDSCKDNLGRLRVGAAVGVSPDTFERVESLINVDVDLITIDSAHGHSRGIIETVKEIKKNYPNIEIIAGNIATPEGAKALLDAGADSIKIGVGPGSICTTRIIAGVGVPQFSAILNITKAIGQEVPVIADGGIRYSGDIVKAIVAGANLIMAGGLFAGVEEAPGETIIYEGRKFKTYRGMGSVEAMQTGSSDRYFQDPEEEINKLVPEGIVGRVPYKGYLHEVIFQLLGGIRAGMGYCGADSIKKLQKAKFIQITAAGVRESHPHDVIITKEAPNYSKM